VIRLPDPCVIVLVGAPGSGKSYWAAENFRPAFVVSSDGMRALVGTGEHDQRASKDAFAVLEDVVDRRLRRRLTTVVDSTGLEDKQRARWVALAQKHGVPVHAVVFLTEAAVCRRRNSARAHPVPSKVLTGQLQKAAEVARDVREEGFDGVHAPDRVVVVPPAFVHAPELSHRQQEDPVSLEFGLQIARFQYPGAPATSADQLAAIARAAEAAGFSTITVMDHFLQIPVVGREWEDMPESYATLGFLAGVTERVSLGTLVTGVTYRNLAHLGKIVATLDVLSGGRAFCGIGAGWFEREHRLYGWDFPPMARRYELLEDALELLPLMWGPGSPSFEGRTTTVPETICYPRPVQEHIPILIGGSGEKKTLRLVARYADACNLFGADGAAVRHKVDVLHQHCKAVDRDPSEVRVTHLSTAGVIGEGEERHNADAGTVDEQIGRYRDLADAGVQTAFVGLHHLVDREPVDRFAEVIAAFNR
jgi:F420-dependent oxidoreductase-like protein